MSDVAPEDRLGRVAYNAWCVACGQDHPLWENISNDLQQAWNAVAQAVLLAIGEKSGLLQDDDDDSVSASAASRDSSSVS